VTYHTIEPTQEALHGLLSREFEPILEIDSGDTVRYRTLDVMWSLEPPNLNGEPHRKMAPRWEGLDAGHALCGPVYIRGAEPGMTLEVEINVIQPDSWGGTYAANWPSELDDALGVGDGPRTMLLWQLDTERMTGTDQHGHTVALRPFMGIIGMPPPEPGHHSTVPPRIWGGNMDCKELVQGSTLYLPISVPGALVSVGDGHAAQGDGEVCGTAIECPMERVELTYRVRDDLHLQTPRAHTPAGWLTFGFDRNLNQATVIALNAMLDLMSEQRGLSRTDALALASVVVDLRITQVANDVWGVHAVLPHGSIQ
jgi:acetamidase/formamidase